MWMSTMEGMRWVEDVGSRIMGVYVGFEGVKLRELVVVVLVVVMVVGESYLDMYARRLATMSGVGAKIDILACQVG